MSVVDKVPTGMPPLVPRIKPAGRSYHDHVVQFYGDDSALFDALVDFVGSALKADAAALVIVSLCRE